MLMGTADKLPDPPPEPTKFVEDMPEVVDVAAMENPAGLRNLGNTCYLNSSMQVIKAIPEVSHALQRYVPAQANEPGASLVLATRELLAELDRSTAAREVLPLRFVSTFRQLFPRFAEQAENGAYAQQDAEVRGVPCAARGPGRHARALTARAPRVGRALLRAAACARTAPCAPGCSAGVLVADRGEPELAPAARHRRRAIQP